MEPTVTPSLLQNLPIQLVPMVGREKERSEILSLMDDPQNRLITLHGFGGSGKTRLAVELGRLAADRFPDGAWFVALAPLESPEQLVTATASALGFTFGSSQDQKRQLFNYLKAKNLLLIFDNFEHLLPEGASFLDELLENAAQVRLLVTSRQSLNTPAEWSYALRGLEYQQDQTSGKLTDSAELFLQQLRRTGQPATPGDIIWAAQISRLVNGLPLALLLAASWGRTLGCDEIFEEIKKGIGFLKARGQTFPEKHHSMQAVFDSAMRLLSEREQAVLRKLSVFRGGFDRAAVLKVTGADLDLIASLVDQSLLERYTSDRYQIHELLRQYLQERLAETGEDITTRNAHLAYYANLAAQVEPDLYRENQYIRIEHLKLEVDNFSTALEWSLESQSLGLGELGLQLLTSIERFWTLHQYARTGFTYLARLLELLQEEQSSRVYIRGLNLAAWLSCLLEELPESRQFSAKALQFAQKINNSLLVSDAYYVQSIEAFYRKEYVTAKFLARQALAGYQAANHIPGMVVATDSLGRSETFSSDFSNARETLTAGLDLARKQGDIRTYYSLVRGLGEVAGFDPNVDRQQSQAYLQEALVSMRRFNDKFNLGHTLNSLGELARLDGKFELAAEYIESAILIEKELGRNDELMLDEGNLGFVFLRLGKYDQSRTLFLKNLDLALKSDHLEIEIVTNLLGLAGLAAIEGNASLTAKILGAIDCSKDAIIFFPTDRGEYERIVSSAQAQLSAGQYDKLFRQGQAMNLSQAAAIFLNPDSSQAIPSKVERLSGLTAREIDVLRQVTYGLSDQEVAERLVISPRTVNAHLTSIYNKLGVDSRGAAAQFAREKGLV
jgi:predicted ATPase/DNA-binding NarL/FixJ family response regulator